MPIHKSASKIYLDIKTMDKIMALQSKIYHTMYKTIFYIKILTICPIYDISYIGHIIQLSKCQYLVWLVLLRYEMEVGKGG
jgi:hypothetical protein